LAYDCAKRNFPGEAISEALDTVGEQKKQCSSSRYIGVAWNKAKSLWAVQLRLRPSWILQSGTPLQAYMTVLGA
jgi:hypothetical protein